MPARLLDRYDRKARLAPAMLVALPAALGLVSLGWAVDQTRLGGLAALLVEFGVPIAMASYTRTVGKRIEDGLWLLWGGAPTTQLLRHRGSTDRARLGLIHAQLAHVVPEVRLPTPADEEADPEEADQRWAAIVEAARSRLRDRPSSRLLFEETCNYGFHRNMLGLRPLGFQVALLAAVVAAVGAIVQARDGHDPSLLLLVAGAAALGAWVWQRLSREHAHSAGRSYAEAFVGALLARDTEAVPDR